MGIAMHVPKKTRVFSLKHHSGRLKIRFNLFVFFSRVIRQSDAFFFAMRFNTPCKNRHVFVMFSNFFS